jgi:hypothetical protein
MIGIGLAPEQRTDIHKDTEDIVFALPDLFAVGGAGFAPGSELPSDLCRIEIKTKQELSEFS